MPITRQEWGHLYMTDSHDHATIKTPPAAEATVVELRQYTLHPGQRDTLIELFDREFVESQEACGIHVIGQFRDLDHPDRFVWWRSFRSMAARPRNLSAFYGGAAWLQHRVAANATMVDSDNVLLLRPARATSGFSEDLLDRPPRATTGSGHGLVMVYVCPVQGDDATDTVEYFERGVAPMLAGHGAAVLGYFVSETAANNFPALPIREGEHVFVAAAGVADAGESTVSETKERWDLLLTRSPQWQPAQVMWLTPTARSLLSGRSPSCAAASPTSAAPQSR